MECVGLGPPGPIPSRHHTPRERQGPHRRTGPGPQHPILHLGRGPRIAATAGVERELVSRQARPLRRQGHAAGRRIAAARQAQRLAGTLALAHDHHKLLAGAAAPWLGVRDPSAQAEGGGPTNAARFRKLPRTRRCGGQADPAQPDHRPAAHRWQGKSAGGLSLASSVTLTQAGSHVSFRPPSTDMAMERRGPSCRTSANSNTSRLPGLNRGRERLCAGPSRKGPAPRTWGVWACAHSRHAEHGPQSAPPRRGPAVDHAAAGAHGTTCVHACGASQQPGPSAPPPRQDPGLPAWARRPCSVINT